MQSKRGGRAAAEPGAEPGSEPGAEAPEAAAVPATTQSPPPAQAAPAPGAAPPFQLGAPRLVALQLKYPRVVNGKKVTAVELVVAPDACPIELRAALALAISAKTRLPTDAPWKLYSHGVPCALSAHALLDGSDALLLDTGAPAKTASTPWPVLAFGLGLLCRYILGAHLLGAMLTSAAAAAASPGKPGLVSLLSRAVPLLGYGIAASAVADTSTMPALLAVLMWLALEAVFLFRCRFVAVAATIYAAKGTADWATHTDARWRKPQGGGAADTAKGHGHGIRM